MGNSGGVETENLVRVPQSIVYLDLNKWIDLARAEAGKDQKYASILKFCEDRVTEGQAVFPLSSEHFMEVAKIGDDSRRIRLAGLMSRLSKGWLIAAPNTLLVAELRRAIAMKFNKSHAPQAAVAFTRSVRTAFGVLENGMEARNDILFQLPGVLEELLSTARTTRDFVNRWQTFANRHEDARSRVCDEPPEIRKRAYCARLTIGIQDRLQSVMKEFDLEWKDLESLGPEGCVELLELVPFFDVEINLNLQRNQHRDRKIPPNDEIDIGFLAMAIPYCNIVVTTDCYNRSQALFIRTLPTYSGDI